MAQAPPKAGAKELLHSLNLIHEFTSLFRRSDFCRFAKESLPTEIGKGRHWTSVFFCGCTSRSQDSPKASPMAIFKWKNLIGQLNHTEPIARMNVEWKLEKAEYAEFNMSTCGKIAVWLSAVQRKTAFVEESWWPEFHMFGSMAWCSFPWHKLLPRLA